MKTAMTSFARSIQIGLIATIIATILGTMISFALVRYRFRGRSTTNLLIFLPPEAINEYAEFLHEAGHGALICSLNNPGLFRSVSAFAPICNPSQCAWGKKAFSGYIGSDTSAWKAYDASELVKQYQGPALNILIDQGSEDKFLKELQLLPDNLASSARDTLVSPQIRMQEGYDHSYYFITTFIDEHIKYHAFILNA